MPVDLQGVPGSRRGSGVPCRVSLLSVSGCAGKESFFTETEEFEFSAPLDTFGGDEIGCNTAVNEASAVSLAPEPVGAGEVVLIHAGLVLDKNPVVGDV